MSNRIREFRQEKGMTLKELSQKTGLASNTISQYETGKREPKLETWQKLSDYFDVPVPYLQGLGMSKKEVVTILIDEIFTLSEDDGLSPYDYSLAGILGRLLRNKIKLSDKEYSLKWKVLIFEDSDTLFYFMLGNKDIDFFKTTIDKYISVVNDYRFLSSLDKEKDTCIEQLRKEIEFQLVRNDLKKMETAEKRLSEDKSIEITSDNKITMDSLTAINIFGTDNAEYVSLKLSIQTILQSDQLDDKEKINRISKIINN